MKYKGVHTLFSEIAVRMPSALAVEYGDQQIRYGELEAKTNNLANFLIASGAPRGSIVAILAEDTIEIITAIIAILKAGCVFVPLDPRLPERRLTAIVAEISAKWFVLESRFYGSIPLTSGAKVICVDSRRNPDPGRGDLTCLTDYMGYCNITKPDLVSDPDDMCYIYFTSGSTGRPKGIAGRLKAIEHFVNWEIKTFGVGEGTRVSQLTSPSFDAYLRDVFVPLCSGGTVCGLKGVRDWLDIESLINWVNQERINLLHCVPSLLRSMLSNGLKSDYFLALKYILLAGEPVLPLDLRKWSDIYGNRIQLVNMYGPSETTMTKLYYFIKATDKDRRSIPIGKPMEGAKALIVTSEGKTCRQGVVGEIYIHTPFRSLGYYNRPELTSEAFIVNPLTGSPDDLIYKTGDLGRVLEDGNLEFLGRKDQQVKIRGIRVDVGEIEYLLLEHGAVKEAAVIDQDDTSGNKYLCAYVVLRKEEKTHELKNYLAERLPDYSVPSMFVMIESLPRTISGKIDRKALPAFAHQERVYVAPRTSMEGMMAGIWMELLGVEKIGINDNFFQVGGHSLLATQLLSRIRSFFAIEIPLREIFASPTVAGLALAITQAQLAEESEEEMDRIIEDIKQLSDGDLEHMLNEEAKMAGGIGGI